MRVVVVGAGVIGLLTAIECVRAGARVTLVDQAGIPSPAATSYDRHRVVRALHPGDPSLTSAAVRAQRGWRDVERRLGTSYYHPVGALTAMPPGAVPGSLALLAAAGAEAAYPVPPEALPARYPRIRFPAGLAAVVEPGAGVVLADRLLAALAAWLGGHPAVRLHPRRRIVGVGRDRRSRPTVRLDSGAALAGDRVILAAGPWSRDLLPAALADSLTLYRQSVLSYAPAPSRRAWAGTPAILGLGGAWLIPPVGDTPVRLSAASACRPVPEMTDHGTDDRWRDHLVEVFGELLTGFDPAAVVEAKDAYYLADDTGEGPLLAALGPDPVWAYAACGGMSFKFAPLVARAIADRALGRPPRPTGLSVDQPRHVATVRREEFA